MVVFFLIPAVHQSPRDPTGVFKTTASQLTSTTPLVATAHTPKTGTNNWISGSSISSRPRVAGCDVRRAHLAPWRRSALAATYVASVGAKAVASGFSHLFQLPQPNICSALSQPDAGMLCFTDRRMGYGRCSVDDSLTVMELFGMLLESGA